MGKVKVFCSGCTEHIGIIEFLNKVNPKSNYECFELKNSCKNSAYEVRKNVYKDENNKLQIKEENATDVIKCPISGKSGHSLRKYAKTYIHAMYKRGSTYTAYIFLDDLDSNPFNTDISTQFTVKEYWNVILKYDDEIEKYITDGIEDIKLIVLLAIPEIESWFLYAWDTAVSDYYSDKPLTTALKKHLSENVFKGYWDKFDEWCSIAIYGKHCKMSDLLIKSFNELQFLDPLNQDINTMPLMNYLGLEDIRYRHKLNIIHSYVKKQDGPLILSLLDPTIIEKKSIYLHNKFNLIRGLN